MNLHIGFGSLLQDGVFQGACGWKVQAMVDVHRAANASAFDHFVDESFQSSLLASAVLEQFDRAFVACMSDCANVQHAGNTRHMRVHASVVRKVVERLERVQDADALLVLDCAG